MLMTNRDGLIEDINSCFLDLSGHNKSYWLGRFMNDLLSVPSRIFLQTHLWPMLYQYGRIEEVKFEIVEKSGMRIPVLVNCKYAEYNGVGTYYWVLFISRERSKFEAELINARNRSEEGIRIISEREQSLIAVSNEVQTAQYAAREITERRQAERVNQAAFQYARSLLEASLDPLVTISADGKITDVNTATEQVTGVDREILIGSDFADYFTDPLKARSGYQQVFSKGSVTDYPLAIRHASGKITDVLYNASLYRDAQGDVLGVFAAARDITESKRLEQTLQLRNADLETAKAVAEEASLAKSNFLSSMSHELRTPLNAILGFAQLIDSSKSPPTPDQKRSIDQILSAGWYLLELVNEILDLVQIESGKVALSREAVPLAHLMSECIAMVEPLAHKRGIEISFPCLDMPNCVYADPTRTRQVLINLLHNAIKYNKPGGKVTVECAHTPSDSIRISVRDTGLGLSAEQIGQLFQPFNRLGKEAGPEQGTGIGLIVVKRLVELMGGIVGVESQIGVGSRFWIELSDTTATDVTAGKAEQAALSTTKPSASSTAHLTVLYVEDNPANLALMEALIMRRSDLRLICAADGNLGVEYARAYLPEVILMDLHLPGISGLDAVRILRSDPTTAHIPVIALSAYASAADIKLAMDAGCFKYITKPIRINEFMMAMDVALRLPQKELARIADKA